MVIRDVLERGSERVTIILGYLFACLSYFLTVYPRSDSHYSNAGLIRIAIS